MECPLDSYIIIYACYVIIHNFFKKYRMKNSFTFAVKLDCLLCEMDCSLENDFFFFIIFNGTREGLVFFFVRD